MEEQRVVTREQKRTMIQELPRVIPVFEEPSAESEKLAKEAMRVLSYRGMLTFNAGGKLQEALQNLQIETLDPVAVYEYQIKFGRAEELKSVIFVEQQLNDDDESEEDDEDEEEDEEEEPVRARVGGRGYSWVKVPIARYAKAIPEFVVRKAIQIKKALPEVKLFIEELQYDPDPFLVATCENENFTEQYYIEVWEEPKFEGRLMKKEGERPEEFGRRMLKKRR